MRKYASKGSGPRAVSAEGVDLTETHPRIILDDFVPSASDIRAVLAKTGKNSPVDELNCGACGYSACREKAIAVLNGYADIEMCLPYMRSRAESMSYEIIQNTPNGIVLMTDDFRIIDINTRAMKLLGVTEHHVRCVLALHGFYSDEFN